jgi:hypothetical protein
MRGKQRGGQVSSWELCLLAPTAEGCWGVSAARQRLAQTTKAPRRRFGVQYSFLLRFVALVPWFTSSGRSTDNTVCRAPIQISGETIMAVFVQKTWNNVPCVVAEGVGVEFSKNGSTLYVVNAAGHRMSMFKAGFVKKYWVESDPVFSHAAGEHFSEGNPHS